MAALEHRPARASDEAPLGEFARALDPLEPARRALTEWGHLAASDPTGLRVWVSCVPGEDPAARLSALVIARGVPARIDGEARVFAEILAASAHPRERSLNRGARIAGRLVEAYLAAHNTLSGDVITYGIAGDRDWRLLRHGLGIEVLRRQPELVAPVPARGEEDLPGGVSLAEAFDGRALGLYERCSARWRTSAQRDERTLNWRFPVGGDSLRLILEGADGGLEGYAVLGPGARGRLCLLDWLVPGSGAEQRSGGDGSGGSPVRADDGAGELLRRGIFALARRGGFAEVAAVLPPWSSDFVRFQGAGYRVRPRGDFVLARSAHAKLDLWWLREHWWFQPFDAAWNGA